MARRDVHPQLGIHIASLNLFLEPDGKLFVTVAGGSVDLIQKLGTELGLPGDLRPAEMVELFVAQAENIRGKS
jgi:hypothetical protein